MLAIIFATIPNNRQFSRWKTIMNVYARVTTRKNSAPSPASPLVEKQAFLPSETTSAASSAVSSPASRKACTTWSTSRPSWPPCYTDICTNSSPTSRRTSDSTSRLPPRCTQQFASTSPAVRVQHSSETLKISGQGERLSSFRAFKYQSYVIALQDRVVLYNLKLWWLSLVKTTSLCLKSQKH